MPPLTFIVITICTIHLSQVKKFTKYHMCQCQGSQISTIKRRTISEEVIKVAWKSRARLTPEGRFR